MHNYTDIPKLISLAERMDTKLHLRPAIKTGNAVLNDIDSRNAHKVLEQYLNNPYVRNGFLATKKTIPESRWYGCGIRKRISIDYKGNLYPCVMDRDSILGLLTDYDTKTLVDALEEETKKFLVNNQNCYNCEYNKDEIRCGGFCRFSYSYKNGTIK